MKLSGTMAALAALMLVAGCNSTYMAPVDPSKSDVTAGQAKELGKRKINVPCRVAVHCADSLIGQRDSFFFTDSFHYPLQAILTNSFKSAAYQVFEPAGGEVIDAFTLHVTVPESSLDVAWGNANYVLQVVVRFNEPGDKRVLALSVNKHVQMPFPNPNVVPDAVYAACRDVAADAMGKILKSPELWRTVKRFEER